MHRSLGQKPPATTQQVLFAPRATRGRTKPPATTQQVLFAPRATRGIDARAPRSRPRATTRERETATMTAEFTAWEKLTGKLAPVAIPLLTSLAPVAVPIYGLKDKVFKGSESGAPLPSNTYKPIVVFSSRKVKDLAAYTAAYDAFATKAQAASDGIRMLFAFPDKAADAVLEVAWVDTPEDLPLLPNAVTNAYVDNAPDAYTVVWGEWTPALKDKIERASCGAKCYFNEGMGGYIKSPSGELQPPPFSLSLIPSMESLILTLILTLILSLILSLSLYQRRKGLPSRQDRIQ